ncbi:hypothetical protein QN239_08075 [Mycolicibacterium sp. Y3]
MKDELYRITEMVRTVQVREAQETLLSLIDSTSDVDLLIHRESIELTISHFLPKRAERIMATFVDRIDRIGVATLDEMGNDASSSNGGEPLHELPGQQSSVEPDRPAVRFKDIKFGYISAQFERRKMPNLLLDGFFERGGVVNDLIYGSEFLVLGYKGGGKSSIAEHIDLAAQGNPNLFVENQLLRDFPYEQVPELVSGKADISVRTNLAWSLLLLLKMFDSLTEDQAVTFDDGGTRFDNLERDLRRLGLLPKLKFRDLVLVSREVNLSVELAKVVKGGLVGKYQEPTVILSHVRDAMKKIICDARTPNRHLLIIDGLDEVFFLFNPWYSMVASLVHEIEALNAEFDENNSAAKIVILCRTDIFERLPSPNINKLRDYSYVIDWYRDAADPTNSDLFALAQHRARVAGYEGKDVIRESIPESLYMNTNPTNTYKFLLDHTRHTPRDFLQLLSYIQRTLKDPNEVTFRDVIVGLRGYSIEYFLPELKDELAGYFKPSEVNVCFQIIGGLRQRSFSLDSLKQYANKAGLSEKIDLETAVRVLFDCSAIGNIVNRPHSDGVTDGIFYTFRYRNRNASVNYSERFILHRGAWKALNLV